MLRKSRNGESDRIIVMEQVRRPYKRKDRLAPLMRQVLSEVLIKDISDPRIGKLTITGVEIRSDMKSALIKVCRMMEGEFREPTAKEISECMKGLKSATPFLFEQLRRKIHSKVLPYIEFRYDKQLAESTKVWGILSELRRQNREAEKQKVLLSQESIA